jgi:hypothetical protein
LTLLTAALRGIFSASAFSKPSNWEYIYKPWQMSVLCNYLHMYICNAAAVGHLGLGRINDCHANVNVENRIAKSTHSFQNCPMSTQLVHIQMLVSLLFGQYFELRHL